MTRSRRAFLGATTTLLLAGCTSTTATTDDTTTTTTATGAVTVDKITVQPEVVALSSPDAISTAGDHDEQYIITTVTANTPTPAADDFQIATDDQSFRPNPDVGGMGGQLWPHRDPYGDDAAGWLAFTVPNPLTTDTATLTWPGGTHPLSTTHLTTLNRPPTTFTIPSFTAPETIDAGENAILTITIANTGDTPGTWVGALNRSGPSVAHIPETAFTIDVPAGETVTHTYTNTPDDRFTNNGGDMEFRLTWRADSLSRTVTIHT